MIGVGAEGGEGGGGREHKNMAVVPEEARRGHEIPWS